MPASKSLKHLVRDNFPAPLVPVLRELYYGAFRATLRPRCALAQLRESIDPLQRFRLRRLTSRRLPPPLLRFRVGEDLDPLMFWALGQRIADDIEHCLSIVGLTFEDVPSVLDFGCGCGRAILPLLDRHPLNRFVGADVDRDAISWCQEFVPDASFILSTAEPPLMMNDGSFDLVYAVSVLTHLDARKQGLWLEEFRRLLKPDGTLIATVHGKTAADRAGFDLAQLRGIEAEGVAFLSGSKLRGLHPDWYQTSFNARAHTESICSGHFAEVHYLEGVFGFQDAVVCRNGHMQEQRTTE
jgi:SAM-dependent methyltransferase